MKTILIMCSLLTSLYAVGQARFVDQLKEGRPQHILVYGTSLSSGACGDAWMRSVTTQLKDLYGDSLITYSLVGKGGMWSSWGVKNLEDSVIAKQPDAVFIEFGINDAFLDYQTPVALAQLNLEYMIDRIRLYSNSCEILLQIMNMPIGKSADLRPHLEDYYNIYRETAHKKGVILIDHYPNWAAILAKGEDVFREYVPDGIHPNPRAGEQVIAPNILKCIMRKTNGY